MAASTLGHVAARADMLDLFEDALFAWFAIERRAAIALEVHALPLPFMKQPALPSGIDRPALVAIPCELTPY